MDRALLVAGRINALWYACLAAIGVEIVPDLCPNDQRVAAIIKEVLALKATDGEEGEINKSE